MGSRVLGEAINSIRNWSVTEAKDPRAPRVTEAFGSLVFNDEVQQTRLPKPIYHALRRTMTHGEPLVFAYDEHKMRLLRDWLPDDAGFTYITDAAPYATPAKALGSSAAGPLQFRRIVADRARGSRSRYR